MKKLFLIGALALLGTKDFAQPPALTVQFEKTFPGNGGAYGSNGQQTTDGGYITFGVTSVAGLGTQMYLIKTDKDGIVQWTNNYGGSGAEWAYSVKQTSDDGYILGGFSTSFGNGRQGYIIKTNSAGAVQWSTVTGSTTDNANDEIWTIRPTSTGYIAVGISSGFGDPANGVYLVKLDNSGGIVWEKNENLGGADRGMSVIEAPNGNYVATGVSYGPAHGSHFLMEVDKTTGAINWTKYITTGTGMDVRISPDNLNILTAGAAWNGSNDDVYLAKTDLSGNVVWSKTFGGSQQDRGRNVEFTSDGGYMVFGSTQSFGAGGEDLYVVKTDVNGIQQWTGTFGNSANEGGSFFETAYGKLTSDGGFAMFSTRSASSGNPDQMYLVKVFLPLGGGGSLNGFTYIDKNNNCTYEPGIDIPIANRGVIVTPGPYTAFSNNNGFYEFSLPDGNYTVQQIDGASDPYTPACPPPNGITSATVNNGSGPVSLNLGNTAPVVASPYPDVNVSFYYAPPSSTPCPGQTMTMCGRYTNSGTVPIIRNLNDNRIDHKMYAPRIRENATNATSYPVTSNLRESCCEQGSGAWSFDGTFYYPDIQKEIILNPGEYCDLCADVQIPSTFPTTGSYDLVAFFAWGPFGGNDYNFRFNIQRIECPNDPNDKKLVSPQACGARGYIPNQELTYSVRFENTGNAVSHNVVIQDKLDDDLDLNTFKIVASSHKITRVEILPDRTLRISFEGIELPDTSAGLLKASGGVVYAITPNTGLADGTEITNQSAIYFDNNEAVLTNTTSNIIRDHVPNVTLAPLNDVYYTDPAFALSGGSPAGGTYSGPGVSGNQFNPSAAGVGTYTITYSYSEALPEDNYSTNKNGTYNPVTGTGTTLTLNDDQVTGALPVGFTFRFYGTDYTNFYLSSNGFITFNPGSTHGCCVGDALPNNKTNPSNLIAFGWDDLFDHNRKATATYFTTGTAPNRKLVVNLTNLSGTVDFNSQVILYEGSNIIEVHTGKAQALNGMTMGVENNGGTKATVVTGRNANFYTLTNDFVQFLPPDLSSLCAQMASQTITVKPVKATITITGDTIFCTGDSVKLTANEQGTYHWSNGASSQSITVKNSGTYTVTVTFAPGITAASDPVHVTTNPLPVVNAGQDKQIYKGYTPSSATLTATVTAGGPAQQYHWSTGASTQSITVAPSSTTTYSVTVTNLYGCIGKDEVVVKVQDVRCGLGNEMVLVCHRLVGGLQQTLCVPKLLVGTFLALGDKLGECNPSLLRKGENPEEVKEMATLVQAYPNPFNTTTTFAFAAPKGKVTLEIYTIDGKKLATLYDAEQLSDFEPHTLEFNAEGLAKGVYFYKLNHAGGVITNKLIIQ